MSYYLFLYSPCAIMHHTLELKNDMNQLNTAFHLPNWFAVKVRFVMEIGKDLALISREMNVSFTLTGKPIPAEEVFLNNNLLPAIIRRADQLCSFCLGYGLGITFDEASDARLGVYVKFDNVVPYVLRIMCATEILYELMESSPDRTVIALDDLMYD